MAASSTENDVLRTLANVARSFRENVEDIAATTTAVEELLAGAVDFLSDERRIDEFRQSIDDVLDDLEERLTAGTLLGELDIAGQLKTAIDQISETLGIPLLDLTFDLDDATAFLRTLLPENFTLLGPNQEQVRDQILELVEMISRPDLQIRVRRVTAPIPRPSATQTQTSVFARPRSPAPPTGEPPTPDAESLGQQLDNFLSDLVASNSVQLEALGDQLESALTGSGVRLRLNERIEALIDQLETTGMPSLGELLDLVPAVLEEVVSAAMQLVRELLDTLVGQLDTLLGIIRELRSGSVNDLIGDVLDLLTPTRQFSLLTPPALAVAAPLELLFKGIAGQSAATVLPSFPSEVTNEALNLGYGIVQILKGVVALADVVNTLRLENQTLERITPVVDILLNITAQGLTGPAFVEALSNNAASEQGEFSANVALWIYQWISGFAWPLLKYRLSFREDFNDEARIQRFIPPAGDFAIEIAHLIIFAIIAVNEDNPENSLNPSDPRIRAGNWIDPLPGIIGGFLGLIVVTLERDRALSLLPVRGEVSRLQNIIANRISLVNPNPAGPARSYQDAVMGFSGAVLSALLDARNSFAEPLDELRNLFAEVEPADPNLDEDQRSLARDVVDRHEQVQRLAFFDDLESVVMREQAEALADVASIDSVERSLVMGNNSLTIAAQDRLSPPDMQNLKFASQAVFSGLATIDALQPRLQIDRTGNISQVLINPKATLARPIVDDLQTLRSMIQQSIEEGSQVQGVPLFAEEFVTSLDTAIQKVIDVGMALSDDLMFTAPKFSMRLDALNVLPKICMCINTLEGLLSDINRVLVDALNPGNTAAIERANKWVPLLKAAQPLITVALQTAYGSLYIADSQDPRVESQPEAPAPFAAEVQLMVDDAPATGPFRRGTEVVIFVAFTEPPTNPTISIDAPGENDTTNAPLPANSEQPLAFSFPYEVGPGNGDATIVIRATNSEGDDLASVTGMTQFAVENPPFQADVQLKVDGAPAAGPFRQLTEVVVVVAFRDAPTNPTISITVPEGDSPTNVPLQASVEEPLFYRFAYVVGRGDGVAEIEIQATDANGDSLASVTGTTQFTVDNTRPTNQNDVFRRTVFAQSGNPIAVNSSGDPSNRIWFAPAEALTFVQGPTMTRANGDATSIAAPSVPGTYYLYVLDAAGNVSNLANTGVLFVNYQDIIFPEPMSLEPGVEIELPGPGIIDGPELSFTGIEVWFAPQNTTEFVQSSTISMAVRAGPMALIAAPQTSGAYRLFVRDPEGVFSRPSVAILTVE